MQALAATLILTMSSTALADKLVSEFGSEQTRRFTVVATANDTLNVPRDLAFNPEQPEQLWVVNRADDSTSIIFNPGTAEQTVDHRVDRYAAHFMEEVSSIAFGDPTFQNTMTFATCHESRNTYNDSRWPDDFMGPTLWPSDLDIYAVVNQSNRLLGSHIDMNHQSPLCMGIAHQAENKFWVFDGKNGHLVFYDFRQDHGPGHDDHSDAIVRRYIEVELTRVADVPGHMVFDEDKRWLYIADTGGRRVLRVDVQTGSQARRLRPRNEPLAEFSEYEGVEFEVFADERLQQPSGLALVDNKLFVTDYETGELIAFDINTGEELSRISSGNSGVSGITLGPNGKLWFINTDLEIVTRVDP